MNLPEELLAKLAAFADRHPEVVAAAEAEAADVAKAAAPAAYDLFEVIRELARRTGLVGGPDTAMSDKAEAAITAYQQANPAPAPDGQGQAPAAAPVQEG
jgi:cell division septum initiation protein DivIVA